MWGVSVRTAGCERAMTVSIGAVRCEECGDLTADEFTMGLWSAYPVPCTLEFVRNPLYHLLCGGSTQTTARAEGRWVLGARLLLAQAP